jgi:hypothetical protein
VSPVKYELGYYIPEDGILHSDRRENFKSYIFRTGRVGGERICVWEPPTKPRNLEINLLTTTFSDIIRLTKS